MDRKKNELSENAETSSAVTKRGAGMKKPFGRTKNGEEAHLYFISADSRDAGPGEASRETRKETFGETPEKPGIQVALTDFGAGIVSILVPDQNGNPVDVVPGYENAAGYEKSSAAFGATVGRVANRISGAKFSLGGKVYELDRNDGDNCNHSGFDGYHKRLWKVSEATGSSVTFEMESPDGDQGFPGNLRLTVSYRVTDTQTLRITYSAEADQDTPLSVTNHCYFNLNGHASGTILDHTMQIFAQAYTPLKGPDYLVDGSVAPVRGTPLDFASPKKIGQDIDSADLQIVYGDGYNHNYVLSGAGDDMGAADRGPSGHRAKKPAARAQGDQTGIVLKVYTDMPCVQFYTGNALETETGKDGAAYGRRIGFALETQCAPDCVNQPGLGSCILRAGETFGSVTEYRFE